MVSFLLHRSKTSIIISRYHFIGDCKHIVLGNGSSDNHQGSLGGRTSNRSGQWITDFQFSLYLLSNDSCSLRHEHPYRWGVTNLSVYFCCHLTLSCAGQDQIVHLSLLRGLLWWKNIIRPGVCLFRFLLAVYTKATIYTYRVLWVFLTLVVL